MIVFVNTKKQKRAEEILSLVIGKTVPKNDGDIDNKEKFANFLAVEKVDPKGPDALEFIYTKLGGLVRTEAEQKAAESRKKEIQAKGRKRMVE